MKVTILQNKCVKESSKYLSEVISSIRGVEVVVLNPFNTDQRDFMDSDLVINYGCNRKIEAKRLVNHQKPVATCIDKLKTLKIMDKAGVPVPRYNTDVRIASTWKSVVARTDIEGNQNKGIKYIDPAKERLPAAPLYTEYFNHKKEFRVVQINAITIGMYEKKRNAKGEWDFEYCDYNYLTPISEACTVASKALGIDFVGFDVLVNKDNRFVILEANSAPVCTGEVALAFKQLVKRMKNG